MGRNHTSIIGGVLLGIAAASHGSTLDFNGADQYVRATPNNLVLTSNVTFEAWVKPPTSRCNTILSRGSGSSGSTDYIFQLGYRAGACNTRVLSLYGAGGWDSSASPVPLNEWTHVAVTFDGAVKKFCINRLLDRVVSRSGQLYQSSSDQPLYVGRQGSSCNCNYFDGELDDVRIWNVVRTGSEIQADASGPLTGNEPGLVVYYPMDEGFGSLTADASGHGKPAALLNNPPWVPGGAACVRPGDFAATREWHQLRAQP